MTVLTAKTAMNLTRNYADMDKKGLWTRFRNCLAENQQVILAGLALMNGNSYYAYSIMLNR